MSGSQNIGSIVKRMWYDPVWSKVISTAITTGVGVLCTFVFLRLDWFQAPLTVPRWIPIITLLFLVPANIWWLFRLASVFRRPRNATSEMVSQQLQVASETEQPRESKRGFRPNKVQEAILLQLFNSRDDCSPEAIQGMLGFRHLQELNFYLTELVENNLVKPPYEDHLGWLRYGITQKGRKHVIEEKLME